jgi:hypothetical protein
MGNENIPILGAVVALRGTTLSAAIVSLTNYFNAARKEEVDRENKKLKRGIEVEKAARLIDAELSRAEAAAVICIEKNGWWPQRMQLSSFACISMSTASLRRIGSAMAGRV